MKLFRILSVNLGLPALVPLLLLASACSSDSDDSPQGAGGSGGSGVAGAAGIAGTAIAGTPSSGGASAGSTGTAGALAGGSAGASAGAAGKGGGAGTGGATAGTGGNVSGGGGSGGATGGASGGGGTAGATGGMAGKGGAGGSSGGATGGSGGGGGFTLSSPAFDNQAGCAPTAKDQCDIFPKEHTNFGTGTMKNVSPEFNWTGAPAGTQSFALVMQDLSNNNFAHWVVWNIPASVSMLPKGLPSGAMLTTPVMANQRGITGPSFFGSGACGNVYEFVLYALGQASVTVSGTDPAAARTTIQGLGTAILGQTNIRARSAMPECN